MLCFDAPAQLCRSSRPENRRVEYVSQRLVTAAIEDKRVFPNAGADRPSQANCRQQRETECQTNAQKPDMIASHDCGAETEIPPI